MIVFAFILTGIDDSNAILLDFGVFIAIYIQITDNGFNFDVKNVFVYETQSVTLIVIGKTLKTDNFLYKKI